MLMVDSPVRNFQRWVDRENRRVTVITRRDVSPRGDTTLTDNSTTALRPMNYRPDIDGLRAIAVVSVVAFHSFADFMPGGFVGVDIFFVISGYLITSIILQHLDRGSFSFSDFYYRRIRRIFPALCFVLLSCLAFGKLVLFPDELRQLSTHAWAGAGFVSNFILWQESGYFDASSDSKPLLHLWSLGIEEQFYIFWPLILWACIRFRWRALSVCAGIAAASFLINIANVNSAPVSTFYSPVSRSWELLLGALLAIPHVEQSFGKLKLRHRSIMSVVGHLFIAIALAFVVPQYAFPGWWALLPTVGAGLIIASGPTTILNKYFLANTALVGIGLISYPLYLWHWPLLSFATILEGARPNDTIRGLMVGLSLLLALATYRLIDLPIRTQFQGARIAKGLAAAVICVASLAVLQSKALVNPVDRGGLALSQLSSTSNPWRYASNELCKSRYPFAGAAKYEWWFCMLKQDRPPTVILLGDSRTNDYYPGFASNPSFSQDNILSIGTCGGAWVDDVKGAETSTNLPCGANRPFEQMEFINAIVDHNPTIRLAVIGSVPRDPTPTFAHQLLRRINYLESKGIQAVVFSPTVSLNYNIRSCYERFSAQTDELCVTGIEQLISLRTHFQKLEQSIKSSSPRTVFYDTNFFCDETHCRFKLNGMPIFRDGFEHISEYASDELIKRFSGWAKINAPHLIKQSGDF